MKNKRLIDYSDEELLFELCSRQNKRDAISVKIDYVTPIHAFVVGIGADHVADINMTEEALAELRHRIIEGVA